MLELVRVNANAETAAVWSSAPSEGLIMGLARTNEELEAIQRLRFKVFTEEMNAVFPDAADGLDADRYDPWCEHVMVKEASSGRVVGTYRFLSPANAGKAGGYYSESEFDIASLQAYRSNMAEVGRSCIMPITATVPSSCCCGRV